jgi:hypothetical protein
LQLQELTSYLLQHPKLGEATHQALGSGPSEVLPVTRTEDALPDGLGEMPSVRPMWTVQEAILHPQGWQQDGEGSFPRYQPQDGKADVVVGYRPPGESVTDLPEEFLAGLLSRVRTMDLDTLDTLCIVINLISQSPDYYCNITPQAIATIRGVRYPNSQQNFLRYRESLQHVAHLTLEATASWSRRRGQSLEIEGHLILVDATVRQRSLGGGHIVLGWRVVAGSALRSILNHTRNLVEVFPQALIQLDTYHQDMAKRLGVYLTWIFRVRAFRGNYAQPFTTRRLIRATNVATGATQHRQKQSQFRDRFENALDTLQENGIIGGWQYLKDPEAELASLAGQRLRRGWFQLWLDLPLRIEPPQQVLRLYARSLKGAAHYLESRE